MLFFYVIRLTVEKINFYTKLEIKGCISQQKTVASIFATGRVDLLTVQKVVLGAKHKPVRCLDNLCLSF